MLELTTTNLIFSEVLKTSGHVDKFQDFMVKDVKTGNPRRADKLVDQHITKLLLKKKKQEEIEELQKIQMDVENYSPTELDEVIKKLKVRDPDTGNELTPAVPFNLMFDAQIGPTGQLAGYLRPETAQGIFVNFRRLLEYNNGRMPFASAQVGLGFRNEIAPRQGLLRLREFAMAEIEHFVDPLNKSHKKFHEVAHIKLPLWSAKTQDANSLEIQNDLTLEDAVKEGAIGNETMAYFMARTFLFLRSVGIPAEPIRFRQHRSTEMAHYANDCWDAEVETSHGWVEIVGHADRSAFDLSRHSAKTKVELVASRPLKEPITATKTHVNLDKKVCGKVFKRDLKDITDYIDDCDEEKKSQMREEFSASKVLKISSNGKDFELKEEHISFEIETFTQLTEKYTPHVIEPSFGIGRIIYCIFEHCFKVRGEDAQRTYFDFPACIAPLTCSILPLISNKEMNEKVQDIKRILIRAGVTSKVDDSSQTVGKRYARTDECGIPFAITVDNDTLVDQSVTLRELDSMKQIRLPISELAGLIISL